tara:strand:- start:66851 stop:67552 length:702 start_codon:yes stop_codon:yes gene_type:complete
MPTEHSGEPRLYLQIASRMAAAMRSGKLQAGERMPSERDLAEQYNVSRSTIREAMIALEINGLVDIRKGSGIYVSAANDEPADIADLPGPFEILEACVLVEGEAAALASQRITQEEIQQLNKLIKRMAEIGDRHYSEEAQGVDRAFHLATAAAARNAAILQSVYQLWDWRERAQVNATCQHLAREGGNAETLQEHRKILSALQQRDTDGARRAMQAHLRRVLDDFSNYTLETG